MIRLQKLLAASGLGSRRTIEDWIRAGRLTLDGRTAQLGDRAGPHADIRLDGEPLRLQASGTPEALLYYKPVGEVTTRRDPQGRPTVFDRLPPPRSGRWVVVGRLDVNTAGLLLLTTDGALAHRLMHPSGEVEREYRVRLRGTPGADVLTRLLKGVALEDGPARFDRIEGTGEGSGSHSSFSVVLREGRNREVRRLFQAVGFEVSRLLRVRYGPIALPTRLRPGQWQPLGPQELSGLAGTAQSPPAGRPPRSAPSKSRARSR
ncbi:MAG: rRNA pseudouridine synthase [Gammaproteobacteria bacterium]|nr:rRNA pseudouridine synthase [Gammaproteobacteria bacterium]